ncbi:hypothetical protein IDJ75_04540 [Mucilaginibacter rigui]|uniref:Uncharacterized protein n=1 Tax=Mucilaginibacter rigui TaxID=534635 RepID=A0ABR7X1Q9_9SPHI|nr:hypothetical protein [Mucilaginibacter rigui]MBD1384537.1 hypothetical protein [Mucilaginibacter rigui]
MISKFRFATLLSLVALTVVIYSACKKDTKTLNNNNDAAIAKTIAVSLYKSFGATIASQSNLTGLPVINTVRNGIKVNDLTCGQYIEAPYSFTHTQADTAKDVMNGSNKYVISCDENNQPNGYTYSGNYVNTGFNPSATYDITVKEYYTLKALAPAFAKMQVDGNQTSVYKTVTKKDNESMVQNNSYILAGLIIDSSSRPFDITAGTATFVSNGTNAGRNFNFTGTIEFLGNHKAKVSFDGKVFNVEIL